MIRLTYDLHPFPPTGVSAVLVGLVHPRLGAPQPGDLAQRAHLPDHQSHGAAQPPRLHGAGGPQEDRRQHLQQTGAYLPPQPLESLSGLLLTTNYFTFCHGVCAVSFLTKCVSPVELHSKSEEANVPEEHSLLLWSHL